MKTVDNRVASVWKTIAATSPISNILFRNVFKKIYTFGLPKKLSGRNKIIIHNFFREQVQTFKYL